MKGTEDPLQIKSKLNKVTRRVQLAAAMLFDRSQSVVFKMVN